MADKHTARYTEIPFPRRKYIPGQGVHPSRDPAGPHVPEVASSVKFGPDTWQDCQPYLYAIDLFNHGYWWEAHEVLEDLWMETGKKTTIARFLQGIIQVAAALLKDSLAFDHGASRLAAKGLPKLRVKTGVFLGLDIEAFVEQVERFLSYEERTLPRIVLHLPHGETEISSKCC